MLAVLKKIQLSLFLYKTIWNGNERIALINGLLDQKVRLPKDTYKLLIAGMQNSVVNSIFKDRTGTS